MLKMIEAILAKKIVTENISICGHERFRGKLTCSHSCSKCRKCAEICPVNAVTITASDVKIDYQKCIFCGKCAEVCAEGTLQHSNKDALAEILTETQVQISEKINEKLGRSLHIRHLDAGSCNACDFEMGALSNPVYDLHRFGIAFVASPRHADMIMVTGVVTRNLEQALRMTYEAMPKPALVMVCGACACSGDTYGSSYAIAGKVADIVPVDIAVPGCPPRPGAMIIALCAAADILKERMK